MQHELVRNTVVNHEARQAQYNSPGIAFLLPLRFAKGEDLDHHTASRKMHTHLVAHLRVVLERGVVDPRGKSNANKAPVWPIDGSEGGEILFAVATDPMIAVRD